MKEHWAKLSPEDRSAYQKRIHPNQSAIHTRVMYGRWAKCSPEERAKWAEHLTNPEAQAKSHEAQRTPEFLARKSAWAKAVWARKSPEEQRRTLERLRSGQAAARAAHPKPPKPPRPRLTPEERRRKSSESMKAYWAKRHAEHPKPPKPLKFRAKPRVNLTLNGETHTQSEWARILGLKVVTIRARRIKGWPVEKVLEPTHGPHDPKPRRHKRRMP